MNWVAFLSYVFVATFTPGPNNIMSMSNASRVGLRKSMRFNLGVFAGFVVIMLLCSYLGLTLSALLPRFKLVMSVIGSVYMLYLAAKIVRSEGRGHHTGAIFSSFWAGLGLQFLNPKAIMYGITVVANFILSYTHSPALLLMFAVALAFVSLVSTTCWSLFGVSFQRLLANYQRPFNIAMGALLIYCAAAAFH